MTDDTRKPVSELSGRELDAAVAEEVMGWEYVGRSGTHSGREYRQGTSNVVGPAPRYSSDIAAAWEVLTRVDWFEWQVRATGDLDGVTCSICPDMESWFRVRADTAPEAICRAALRAVREGVGDG